METEKKMLDEGGRKEKKKVRKEREIETKRKKQVKIMQTQSLIIRHTQISALVSQTYTDNN